jgi:hypothetical protein
VHKKAPSTPFLPADERSGIGMFRNVASKVMWVGRTASMVFGLALVMALLFGVATMAMGATGGNFLLGKANGATTASKLTASIAGPALTLVNQSTDTAATALNISVASGKAPLKVNAAAGTATGLSADELDGQDSAAYQKRVNGSCPDGSSIRSIAADGSASCEPDDQGDGGTAHVNQLRTELGTNDGASNEAADPVSYTKVKDIPADVVDRNADKLDNLDSSALSDKMYFKAGLGVIPNGTLQFLAPTVQVALAPGQAAQITSNQALGTLNASGAGRLNLYICYRDATTPAVLPTPIGGGAFNNSIPAGPARITMGLSAVLATVAAGQAPVVSAGNYDVGLCGRTDDGNANWNNNEWGYTTAEVARQP